MTARRRARKLKATPAWANSKKINAMYRAAHEMEGYEVDHIVPLNSPLVCGLHWEGNLQILLAPRNRVKSNRYWPDMPGGENLEFPF
jgi:5-methylcytosine-specific restriction endonuclease McrA